jgi:co-chaperonin GroES (HSP10)
MFNALEIKSIRPILDHVIVEDMNFGERVTSGGIVLRADDARLEGIRPRWARVYAVGKKNRDVSPGQWILVSHGRWTRGIKIRQNGADHVLRRVDVADILAVSDEAPSDDTVVPGL